MHLGLGNFFRAHQAWYTEHAFDADDWGYAAFAGRGADLAGRLAAQDSLYTLLQRGPQRDSAEIIASVSEVHPGADHAGWLALVASPRVAAITVTVTEAGWCRGPDGGLDVSRPDVAADLARLRDDISASVATAPARLVAGLAARRAADGGPLALVPCDNVAGNGALAGRVVTDVARLVDRALVEWIEQSVSVVTTVVDRITPRTGSADIEAAARATGRSDEAPVVTESFSEWVLAGELPAGRPRWEDAGAIFTDDVTGYEHRKLWLLNGAHSLLAYAGSALGHRTVAEAIGDDRCRGWVQQWWATAGPHLDQPTGEIATYQDALVERFANTKMHDELARIAEDGSQKLPIRVLPVLRAERADGRLPAAATRIIAAWLCHLRGLGTPVHDVRADELVPLAAGPVADAARQVLDALDPELGADTAVVAAVAEQCHELAGTQK
ncbi:MAG: mannitol dehydrogenase family protein [Actinomycetota bacterium]|nr:mannitol dehydrogenase family protein [Actinomycetota bacterium]